MHLNKSVEKYREKEGFFATKEGDRHGRFFIPLYGYGSLKLQILSSGEQDPEWEHVSVSLEKRCPNWKEMCLVKDLFWDESECVIQFHPPRSEYVNNHPFCLHLWKSRTLSLCPPLPSL